jgi:hypothetical protein
MSRGHYALDDAQGNRTILSRRISKYRHVCDHEISYRPCCRHQAFFIFSVESHSRDAQLKSMGCGNFAGRDELVQFRLGSPEVVVRFQEVLERLNQGVFDR